jgi:hypothetical protein
MGIIAPGAIHDAGCILHRRCVAGRFNSTGVASRLGLVRAARREDEERADGARHATTNGDLLDLPRRGSGERGELHGADAHAIIVPDTPRRLTVDRLAGSGGHEGRGE